MFHLGTGLVKPNTVCKNLRNPFLAYPFAKMDKVARIKGKLVLKATKTAKILHVRIFYPQLG
jgi:hypothetical protein